MKLETIEDFDKLTFNDVVFDEHFLKSFQKHMSTAIDDLKYLEDEVANQYPSVPSADRLSILMLAYNRGVKRGILAQRNHDKRPRKKFLGIF